MIGSTRQRQLVLAGTILLVAAVDFLDLVGVLRLGLSTSVVLWPSTLVAAVLGLTASDRQEAGMLAASTALAFFVSVVSLIVAVVLHPDAGRHYLFYATTPGLVAVSLRDAAIGAVYVLGPLWSVWAALDWLSDYHHLRRTTPEERVLGDS